MSGAPGHIEATYRGIDDRFEVAMETGDTAIAKSAAKTDQTINGVRHIQSDAGPRVEAVKALFTDPVVRLKRRKFLHRERRKLSLWAIWARLHPRAWWARIVIVALYLWINRRPIITTIVALAAIAVVVLFWQDILDFLVRAWRTMRGMVGSGGSAGGT